MLLQSLLYCVVLYSINSAWGAEQTVAKYLQEHAELSPVTDQITMWDRSSLPAEKDITYPVENQPVPEIVVRIHEEGKRERKKTSKKRQRRQSISPDSCYLLVANRVHLLEFQNVPSFRVNLVLTGFSNAVAVDFDKRDGYLFWSDVQESKIYRSQVDGSELKILVDKDISVPDGIAWDWVSKKLYWTDFGDKDLEVLDPATGCREKLFQFGATSKPRDIVVDPKNRYMYWTDWGSPATVERASMDGSNHTVLHNTNLWWPNALTIDYTNQQLYWLDAAMDKIETSSVDGSNRLLLTTVHVYHPFSVAFYNNQLFWSDWELKAVLAAPLSNISATSIVFGDLTLDPMGLTAVCIDRQELVANPCEDKCGSKQLCLLSPNTRGYSCACANNCTDLGDEEGAAGDSEPECSPTCGTNEECTGPNKCTCSAGWRGASCSKGVCSGGCIHGECIAPDMCSCDGGWDGERCDEAVCCLGCANGDCTSPDVCTCNPGWTGTTCETPTGHGDGCGGCVNGGSCKPTGCDCPPDYGGLKCEKNCLFQTC